MLKFYNTLSRKKEVFLPRSISKRLLRGRPWEINWYQLRESEILGLKGNLLRELVNLGIKKAGSLNRLSKSIGMSNGQLWFDLNKPPKLVSVRKLKRLALFIGIKYDYFNNKISEIRKGKVASIKNPKFPFNLATKEGAAILGNIVSDGCIYIDKKARNVMRTKYAAGTKEELEKFIDNINKIFGKVYFQKEEMRNSVYLKIGSSIIAEGLCKVGAPIGNKAKIDPEIPWLIKKSPEELKKAYLRAIFDDEGCIAGKELNFYINCSKKKRYDLYITFSRSIHINKYLNETQKRLLKKIEPYMKERQFPTGHKIKSIEIRKAIKILKTAKENIHSIKNFLLEIQPKLLRNEAELLTSLGIQNRIRNSRLDLTGNGTYSVVSELRIQRRKNVLNFYRKINFGLSNKKERLKTLLLDKKWI